LRRSGERVFFPFFLRDFAVEFVHIRKIFAGPLDNPVNDSIVTPSQNFD
jgi:hypothetical protein